MGLLLTVCEDCIGAVSVYAEGRRPKWQRQTPEKRKHTKNTAHGKAENGNKTPSSRCLACFEKLPSQSLSYEYHDRCSRQLFGTRVPPHADFTLDDTIALQDV